MLLDQLNNDSLLRLWKTGARFEQHRSADDEKVDEINLAVFLILIYTCRYNLLNL